MTNLGLSYANHNNTLYFAYSRVHLVFFYLHIFQIRCRKLLFLMRIKVKYRVLKTLQIMKGLTKLSTRI